jgi:hypothetical protein
MTSSFNRTLDLSCNLCGFPEVQSLQFLEVHASPEVERTAFTLFPCAKLDNVLTQEVLHLEEEQDHEECAARRR